jgi:O-methyltransferase
MAFCATKGIAVPLGTKGDAVAVISDANLLEVMAEIAAVPGDFAEIGIFKGHTFKRLSMMARVLGRVAHGFDSFEGMAPPTDRDAGHYPAGKLSVGGVEAFIRIMADADIPASYYRLHKGWIPECFPPDLDGPFAFSLVDVDQYAPTIASLDWIWPRMAYGGVMLLDDYFPGRGTLAAGAIDEWLAKVSPFNAQVIRREDTQLYVRRLDTSMIRADSDGLRAAQS